MTIDIITLFPGMFQGPFDESMIKRAQDKGLVTINIHYLRKWAVDKRGTVDGHPYSGGAGMLLRPEPIFNAVEEIRHVRHPEFISGSKETNEIPDQDRNDNVKRSKIVLLDAGGTPYNQKKAEEFAKLENIILICGHYEGVDFRVHEHLADEVISVGDYVMTGGEIPAMIIADSVTRLLPGVLNKEEATQIESFSQTIIRQTENKKNEQLTVEQSEIPSDKTRYGGTNSQQRILEYPQYTKPDTFRGWAVPEVLKSGHHAEIEKWRHEQAIARTKKMRPDL